MVTTARAYSSSFESVALPEDGTLGATRPAAKDQQKDDK
jgi:hypothetical protein